jgi:hypothetical protein
MDLDLSGIGSLNIESEEGRRGMANFAKAINQDYRPNWHHLLLCKYLDDFFDGKIKRLMVFMPPQEGKSELTSRLFPAYMLGKRPNTKIVLGSYAADIAEKFNRDVQKYIDNPHYVELFPYTKLTDKNNGGVYVRNTQQFDIVGHKGFLKTVGVGGALTGTPADFAIIDDPHKDMAEAQSPIMQERVWDWYNDVVTTRLHNDSGILLIQTRWDVGDLAGRILQKVDENKEFDDAEQWTILCLQGIKEGDGHPDDPRKQGEALWPERHDINFLNKQKRRNPRGFQHLYQQNPMPVQAGGEAYNCFSLANTGKHQYNPELALHASFDFNVNPYMSCSIWQIDKIALPDGTLYKAAMIREICLKSPRNNTKAVCAEIRRLYPNHEMGIYIYGDPNGFKEDTRSEKGYNDYKIITQELKAYNPKLRVMMKAPAVRKRIEFMNSLFAGGYDGLDISIDSGCTKAIEDFQYVKEDADGTKLKAKVRDPITGVQAERYGHMSDNSEYFICGAFPSKYQKFLQGGSTSQIIVGKRKARNAY